MAAMSANQGWFNISVEGGPEFAVYSLKGTERLNRPYEFELELVSRDSGADLIGLLGRSALITIADHSGGQRRVHGSIREAEQLHTANVFTHYRIWLVPRLWYLGCNREHRIFQNMTPIQIIDEVLKKQGFTPEAVSWKLNETYEEREYCVQYGESDLHFISRLCEEEGVYFYFEHADDRHTLCFSDAAGGPMIPEEQALRFFPGSGEAADKAVISRLELRHKINSDRASYREWNFTSPRLDLEVLSDEADHRKAPVPGGLNLEVYKYPHLYQYSEPGSRYSGIQLGRQLTFARWVEGQADVSRLTPGFGFDLGGHPRADVNARWWLTEVSHFGEQPQVLEHEAPDRGFLYQSRFTAIPFETRFIPAIEHPKNPVIGQQTAIVTGPAGEEIYPDRYGRVKVEFHWDRLDPGNERSSCWIRVSQGWAGAQYGAMAIPRVGHEVVVSFLEGDPDRPLITGRVYHAENMPPYALPEHKTRMTIRSKTYKGSGYNELRFEDMNGNEQVYLHGQRDLDVLIENDRREWIKHDRHLLVENERIEEVTGQSSSQVGKDRIEATGGKRTVTVGGDEAHQVGGARHLKVSGEVFIEGLTSGVLEMHKDLTIKAPGGFIRIDGSGITIVGKIVNVNAGGSPGAGFPVQAIPARRAAGADSREAGSGQESKALPQNSAPALPVAVASLGGAVLTSEDLAPGQAESVLGAEAAASLDAASALMQKAPAEIEALNRDKSSPVAAEWRKAVADAGQETSLAGKLESVQNYFDRAVMADDAVAGRAELGPKALLEAGQGSDLETAVTQYHALSAAGAPEEALSVAVARERAFLLVEDGSRTTMASSAPGAPPLLDAAALTEGERPVFGLKAGGRAVRYLPK